MLEPEQGGAFDAMRDTVPGDVAPSEEMVGFRIKTTFDPSSREDVILRRLRLRLVLTSPEDDRPVGSMHGADLRRERKAGR